ncbi:hypothetical protein [uncultured Bilophila sp.]|uniref:hypothetical protein n=1 Tax=uncultured Bilophila sp. TaxID=529385 RepID=UPI00266FAFDB|nr:hypothetical protein [uncultured Bilophila sp.]
MGKTIQGNRSAAVHGCLPHIHEETSRASVVSIWELVPSPYTWRTPCRCLSAGSTYRAFPTHMGPPSAPPPVPW